MNFIEWQAHRDKILEKHSPLRLDCLNPFISMNFLKESFSGAANVSSDQVLDLWAERMNAQDLRGQTIATPGVRESLKALFGHFAETGKQMVLAEDIYPFYWQEATKAGLEPLSFKTLPSPDFEPLKDTSDNTALLITSPLSPLGRDLNEGEVAALKSWLDESIERTLILDTVYNYRRGFDASTRALYDHGQTVIAHSLSKAWLERGIFGALTLPERNQTPLEIFPEPSQASCNSAFSALEHQELLADIQQRAFEKEWARLTPAIQKFAPDFTPPQNGYMAVVPANAVQVLNAHNTMIVPASVFGSSNDNLSVMTCLHDLHLHV